MRLYYLIDSLGLVISAIGIMSFIPCISALIYGDMFSLILFAILGVITTIVGHLMHRLTPSEKLLNLKKTEALAIVLLSWVSFWLVASIPFLFYGLTPINALFEAISGITSCGATILTSFDFPKTFFFWRAFIQWLGGMGIIILFTAVLPQFAVAGRQMFFAEAPGSREENLTPRIKYTASALWGLYVGLTALQIILLYFTGLKPFDAICIALTTISAGGFSPPASSVGGYHSMICNWICILFMFIAGCNFALMHKAIVKKDPTLMVKNEEFRFYFLFVSVICLILAGSLFFSTHSITFNTFTDAVFSTVSIITSTGHTTADFAQWSHQALALLFCTTVVGSCAGSCGGGIKIARAIICLKYLKSEITKILHPNAVINIKLDNAVVSKEVRRQVLTFIIFYFIIFMISVFVTTLIENDLVVGLSGSVSTLGLIGVGAGSIIGPADGFNNVQQATKILFMFNMLIGRLEIVPVIVLLNKDFWKLSKQ